MRSSRPTPAAALLATALTVACAPAGARPAPRPAPAAAVARRGYTAADVRFMQHMIAHHAQAIEMTGLVPARSTSEGVRLLAERMAIAQRDEIRLMQQWLADRGEIIPAPDTGAHGAAGAPEAPEAPAMAGMARMPGMLTEAELGELAATTGPTFDQRFLAAMIRHHQGALAMVASLFATPGAAQESAVYRLASDIDATQRAEIARMQALQRMLSPGSSSGGPSGSPSGRAPASSPGSSPR